jgi:hypothetical protein
MADMEDETIEVVRNKFVFVVDGDVGMIVLVNPNGEQLKQVNCLRNNPEIVEVEQGEGDVVVFDFINDGVVNSTMDFPNTPAMARFIACLRSNPTILEVEPSNPVRSGWTYDGTDFRPEQQ